MDEDWTDQKVLALGDFLARKATGTRRLRCGMTDEEMEQLYAQMPHIPGDPPLHRYWLEEIPIEEQIH
jgi:hypothetical protein